MNDQIKAGNSVYALPNGSTLVLNPRRQAKKIIMRTEGRTSRSMRRERKRLKREQKARRAHG